MIPKSFILKAPVDNQIVPLEQLLTAFSKKATQFYNGTYLGTGKEQTIATPFTPQLIITYPVVDYGRFQGPVTQASLTFSFQAMPRLTFCSLSEGFRIDAVTSIQYNSFTLGTWEQLNALGQQYNYFILG
jgi:hypothetical protein